MSANGHSAASDYVERVDAARLEFPFLVDPEEKYDANTMVRLQIGDIQATAYRDVCVACGELCGVPGLCQQCQSERKSLSKKASADWTEGLIKKTHQEVDAQRQKNGSKPYFSKPAKPDGRSNPNQKRSDGNDYTKLTEPQIAEIRRLKSEGLTIKQIARKMAPIKEWRIQQAAADVRSTVEPRSINRAEKNPYDGTHLRAEDIASAPAMTKAEYESKFGIFGKKEFSEQTLDMWRRIEQLPIGSLLVLPMKDGESTNSARSRYSNLVSRCVRRFKPKFRVRMVSTQRHRHVVMYKESLQ